MGAGLWSRARRGKSLPAAAGPTALLVVSAFFLGVVFWGYFNPAEIRVVYFDVGRADSFEINRVTPIAGEDLWVVGMEDGRLRAIDGRLEASGCVANWLPDDVRGRSDNPQGLTGVFEDPCSGALWSMNANAIEGTDKPLRTPFIYYRANSDGSATHAFIERVNP